jgi:large subunit ribosomal protein L30e
MDEIKKGLKEGKLILGTKRTVKAIRAGGVSKIFLASNCPDVIVEDIEHYCAITEVPIEKLTVDCNELGSVCKKPFYVSVVGIVKV